ncbi:hypothetical protein H7E67_10485 [Clostridium gasigenes]|uniref:hypothetical protein n=1 Tax=Clostridium gasigenes TaxID=94869 RepID=UPI0016247227|nr:hypothetical protein [Clostridium gasigenes]MBB6623854.1 hypothetical protein [Clostridium gasigenes]
MKVLKSFKEVAEATGSKGWEVMKAYENSIGRGLFFVNDIEVIMHAGEKELLYVIIDSKDNKDCKEYMMQYELQEYDFKVYTDEIIGWESCKVIDIENTRLGIDRATVVTKTGTQLNRVCKFVSDEEDQTIKEDGCIYFYEK